jgi:hypothetical protein
MAIHLPAEMLAPYLGSRQLSPAGYYSLTYVSLLLIYLLALAIQSAYQVRCCMCCRLAFVCLSWPAACCFSHS